MSTRGWVTVHDADSIRRKRPEGKEMLVRAEAIDTIRAYGSGRVRAVLGIHGSYLHVTETRDEILRLIDEASR